MLRQAFADMLLARMHPSDSQVAFAGSCHLPIAGKLLVTCTPLNSIDYMKVAKSREGLGCAPRRLNPVALKIQHGPLRLGKKPYVPPDLNLGYFVARHGHVSWSDWGLHRS